MPTPKTPLLTVDCVIIDRAGRVLLIERRNPPFQGRLALPGGFVQLDETTEDACRRETREETGLRVDEIRLVGVYSKPGRDPRGPTCSIAYLAAGFEGVARAGSDAAAAHWVADWRSADLAFDHATIIADAELLAKRG